MVKSILKKGKTNKKKTNRVRFNKYKKVKTIRNRMAKSQKSKPSSKKQTKRKKPLKLKGKGKGKGKGNSNKKNKTKRRKTKRATHKKKSKHLKLNLKMKGGCGSNMGEKVTGIPYNSDPALPHPKSTNLNSSIPTPYQSGGGVFDDLSIMKQNIMDSANNMIAAVSGGDKVMPASVIHHPEMTKSLMKYPKPIDVKTLHQQSKYEVNDMIESSE